MIGGNGRGGPAKRNENLNKSYGFGHKDIHVSAASGIQDTPRSKMSFGSASDQANGTFCKWACQTKYNDYGRKRDKGGATKTTLLHTKFT